MHVDHQAVLHARQKFDARGNRLDLHHGDTDRAANVRTTRIVQVHYQHVDRLLERPDVPPFDRAVRGGREKLRVGFGIGPARLVRRISFARRR